MASTVKCTQCGLVNFGQEPTCRRCQYPLDLAPEYGASPDHGAPIASQFGGHYGSDAPPFGQPSMGGRPPTPDAPQGPGYGAVPVFPAYDPRAAGMYGAPQTSPYGQAFGGMMPGAVAGGVWRHGDQLLVYKYAQLPDRCIKCNSPASGGRVARTLYWHPPWVYAFLFLGPLLYLVVAAIIQKRARVELTVCAGHAAKRRNLILAGWVLFLLALSGIVIGVNGNSALFGLLGVLFFLTWVVVLLVVNQFVSVVRIDGEYVWIKNVASEFLASLPPSPSQQTHGFR